MKYKVGDKVRIRHDLSADELKVNNLMISFAGLQATITKVYNDRAAYAVDIDEGEWVWYDRMLENVDDAIKPNYYQFHGYDVFDIADYFGLGFPLGNALKYLLRAGKKDSATWEQDLSKCKKCIERAMEMRSYDREEYDAKNN
jgi:hypothetical protein